jgi:hypothetical protein
MTMGLQISALLLAVILITNKVRLWGFYNKRLLLLNR